MPTYGGSIAERGVVPPPHRPVETSRSVISLLDARVYPCSELPLRFTARSTIPLSRRRFLSVSLASAAALRTALAQPPLVLTPEQEVGPFYVPDELLRSAIAEGKPGLPLRLKLTILDGRTGTPLPHAAIDLWHCDALGVYSGYTRASLGPPPSSGPGGPDGPEGGPPPGPPPDGEGPPRHPGGGPPPMHVTDHETFLRGIQLTGPDGAVEFLTIFPGFYQGRTNHIHFKVRLGGHPEKRTYAAGHTSHVGQVFFPEPLAARLMQQGPYADHTIHRVTEAEDGIFQRQHGSASLADVTQGHNELLATLKIAVDPTATPAPVPGFGGAPR